MKKYIFLLTVLSFVIFQSCNSEKHNKNEQVREQFCLPDSVNNKLETVKADLEIVQSELNLTAKVASFENKEVKVEPLVNGIIQDIVVDLGDYVKKGQTLAIIRSTDVADVENDIITAESNLMTAKKNLKVMKDLYKSGLASTKDIVIAENELLKAESELQKSKTISSLYSIDKSLYTLKAPISGFVLEKNPDISETMPYHLEQTGPFFRIADLSEVQIVAHVYETDISKIKLGNKAKIKLLAYPGESFIGKIDKINNVIDPSTRTMNVRINLKNPRNLLKPDMFAVASIISDETSKMITIPSNAIISDRNRTYVMIFKDKCHMETRRIKVTKTTGNKSYVSEGLKEGETIMTKYQNIAYEAMND